MTAQTEELKASSDILTQERSLLHAKVASIHKNRTELEIRLKKEREAWTREKSNLVARQDAQQHENARKLSDIQVYTLDRHYCDWLIMVSISNKHGLTNKVTPFHFCWYVGQALWNANGSAVAWPKVLSIAKDGRVPRGKSWSVCCLAYRGSDNGSSRMINYRAVRFRLFREPDTRNLKYSDTRVAVNNLF